VIPLGKCLENGQKKRSRKIHKKHAAGRPAERSDLKSIDPTMFYEKNVILQR